VLGDVRNNGGGGQGDMAEGNGVNGGKPKPPDEEAA
jgi:hypothetical protein